MERSFFQKVERILDNISTVNDAMDSSRSTFDTLYRKGTKRKRKGKMVRMRRKYPERILDHLGIHPFDFPESYSR